MCVCVCVCVCVRACVCVCVCMCVCANRLLSKHSFSLTGSQVCLTHTSASVSTRVSPLTQIACMCVCVCVLCAVQVQTSLFQHGSCASDRQRAGDVISCSPLVKRRPFPANSFCRAATNFSRIFSLCGTGGCGLNVCLGSLVL